MAYPRDTITVTYADAKDDSGNPAMATDTTTVQSMRGVVTFDQESYTTGNEIKISLTDLDLNIDPNNFESATVELNGQSVSLHETEFSGEFTGTVTLDGDAISAGPGDTLTVTYQDQLDEEGNPAEVTDTATWATASGTVSFDAANYAPADPVTITLTDADLNLSPSRQESYTVQVKSDSDDTGLVLTVHESGIHSDTFTGTLSLGNITDEGIPKLKAAPGDTITVSYVDTLDVSGLGATVTGTGTVLGTSGAVEFDASNYAPGSTAIINVRDSDLNLDPVAVTIPAGVTDASLQAAVDNNSAILPLVSVQAESSLGTINMQIPAWTMVTGPAGWDGTIMLPTLQANNSVQIPNGNVSAVVKVGLTNATLTLSHAVRIVLPGQAGKAAAHQNGNNLPVLITRTLSADTQDAADNEIPAGGEGKIDAGQDLVIWTKHFTKYIAYTPVSPGGGGGNSGGNGGGLPADVTPPDEKPAEKPEEIPAANLSDIANHWAKEPILQGVQRGIAKGYPDGTFKPNYNITRAEFAVMLVRAFNLVPKEGKVFTDTASHWAAKDIATAAAYGIVSGYQGNLFRPNDLINREQMAAMLVKAAQLEPVPFDKGFTDSSHISPWAKEAVNTAAKNGLISGYPDGTFKPQAKATRAEAVAVILRVLVKK